MKLVVTIAEVAKMLGISLNHAYDMANTGQIPSIKLGRRIMGPTDALNKLLKCELEVSCRGEKTFNEL